MEGQSKRMTKEYNYLGYEFKIEIYIPNLKHKDVYSLESIGIGFEWDKRVLVLEEEVRERLYFLESCVYKHIEKLITANSQADINLFKTGFELGFKPVNP
jgi:hypothetical protein